MNIAELATATGKHPMDAMLDLAIDEGLRTEFTFEPTTGTDRNAVKEILNHPFTHPCVSDGGAHTRYQTLGSWPVNMIADRVRDQGMMTLEEAHYKMSSLPAAIAGFTDRGIIKEGLAADIIGLQLRRNRSPIRQPGVRHRLPGWRAPHHPEGQGHSLHHSQR